jgi:colanic acid/amylovoran biosynthesis glycosyltransferase
MNKPILIYHNQLLPPSEVFIYNQSIPLKQHTAYFLGIKFHQGLGISLPLDRIRLINGGGPFGITREALFKLGGVIPLDIRAWIKDMKPHLIHAHFGFDGAIALPLVKYTNVPLVVSFLGSDATIYDDYAKRGYYTQQLYLKRRQSLINNTNMVVVPSEFLKKKVIEQGFSEDKIRLIHHGVDLTLFDSSTASPMWGNILYVGRLIPSKGLPFLIEALRQVRKRFPNTRLIVIGDGPERSSYESLAREYLTNGFTFLGVQPHSVVQKYMAQAYVFSMPSNRRESGEEEAFGLVFVEAQASGVPVISFATGGIPEIVQHGVTGFLAKEKNIAELIQYLETLLEKPEMRIQMGIAARERTEQMFDLAKQNEKLEDLYEEVYACS